MYLGYSCSYTTTTATKTDAAPLISTVRCFVHVYIAVAVLSMEFHLELIREMRLLLAGLRYITYSAYYTQHQRKTPRRKPCHFGRRDFTDCLMLSRVVVTSYLPPNLTFFTPFNPRQIENVTVKGERCCINQTEDISFCRLREEVRYSGLRYITKSKRLEVGLHPYIEPHDIKNE